MSKFRNKPFLTTSVYVPDKFTGLLKNRAKDYLTLIICIILMLGMVIYSIHISHDGGSSQNVVTVPDAGTQDTAAVEINYVVQNGVTTGVERVYSTEQIAGNGFNTKVVVSGLADTTVENKINRSILDKYNEMYDRKVSPYRGITSTVDINSEKQYKEVSMEVMGNYNNILSILVSANYRQSDIVFTDCETLNYDLRTGELVKIGQLFPEEETEYLNKWIGNNVVYFGNEYPGGNMYNPLKNYYMLSAFRGVNEDQKFYFDEYGITIVIDYSNDEFYMTGFKPFFISVPYAEIGGHIDFSSFINCGTATGCDGNESLCYFSDNDSDKEEAGEDGEAAETASIYTNDVKKYMLIGEAKGTEFKTVNVPAGSSNLTFSASCSYPSGTPDAIVKKAEKLAEIDSATAKSIQGEAQKNANKTYSCMSGVSVNKTGNYYNVAVTVDCLRDETVSTKTEGHVYDENGNEIKLEDMFMEESKYMEVIKTAVANQLADDFTGGNYGGKSIDDICKDISFVLENSGMQIKTQPLQFSDYESSVSVFIPYEKFGCDYITIFN